MGILDAPALTPARADARYAAKAAAAPLVLQTRTPGLSEYPTVRRLDKWWFPFDSQPAPSMLWPAPVDMRGWPGALDNIYVFYGTDHGTDSATTGIHLATMSDWDGTGLQYRGRVYSSTGQAGWSQPETPSVWLDRDAGLIRMILQVNIGTVPEGENQSEQASVMITSATGLAGSWTLLPGFTMARPSALTPGPAHCGYANPFRLAGSWLAYSLMGGSAGAMAAFGLWRSSDPQGLPGTWTADPGRISLGESLVTLPGFAYGWNFKITYATIVDLRGRLWVLSLIGPSAAGLEDTSLCDLYAAPLTPDLRQLAARPVKVTPPLGSVGTSEKVGSLGRPMQYNDVVVIPFRQDTKQTNWGAFILDAGVSA